MRQCSTYMNAFNHPPGSLGTFICADPGFFGNLEQQSRKLLVLRLQYPLGHRLSCSVCGDEEPRRKAEDRLFGEQQSSPSAICLSRKRCIDKYMHDWYNRLCFIVDVRLFSDRCHPDKTDPSAIPQACCTPLPALLSHHTPSSSRNQSSARLHFPPGNYACWYLHVSSPVHAVLTEYVGRRLGLLDRRCINL